MLPALTYERRLARSFLMRLTLLGDTGLPTRACLALNLSSLT